MSKVSPVRANFQTIDNSNSNNNNDKHIKNCIGKPTPLLADIKRYQDKLTKKNSNFEYRKINNCNYNIPKQAEKTENKSGAKKTNYFEDNSSYNKLVQKDKLNYSNNINKTNHNESAKILNSKNGSILHYGFNFTNMALNSANNNKNENEKVDIINYHENKKRPVSSNCDIIIHEKNNLIEETNMENYRKININKANNKTNLCKERNTEKTDNKNKSEGNISVKGREINNTSMTNVDLIIKCLKFVKFPKNYIDYYKIVLNKLQHSKSNTFLICVLEDKKYFVI